MKSKKITAIIQAHMSSERLPQKIMLDLEGEPVLFRMLERVKHSKLIDTIVVATSDLSCDDIVASSCKIWGVEVSRGSDSDVLSRYWKAAQEYPSDVYMRLTSDSPLIDPDYLDMCIDFYLAHSYRYVAGDGKNPIGIGCELFTAELLKEAAEKSTEPFEHEHVTPYMYWKQDSIGRVPSLRDATGIRITLDTKEDYEVIKTIYHELYQPGNRFTMNEILDYLEAHPEVAAINAAVEQKKVKTN